MFLTDMLHSTLQLDQTLSSHPIVQTVSNPDQITEIFDVISYQKVRSQTEKPERPREYHFNL